MNDRTITLRVEDAFAELVSRRDVDRHIGYLACWGLGRERFANVLIYCGADGNISAHYHDPSGQKTYALFGLRGEDGTYSFHS
jgi:hypothetical protein